MLTKRVNILFFFAIIIFFALFAKTGDHLRISVAVLLAVGISIFAFFMKWLTIDGGQSATVVGSVALGLGNSTMAVILIVFFISASLVSKHENYTGGARPSDSRRTGEQVWANGFWFTLWIFIWAFTGLDSFLAAAAAAITAATADTWATEIGNRFKDHTYLITNFEKVESGTNGGVSLSGTLAAVGGAVVIALLFWLLSPNLSVIWFPIIAAAGVLGCFADSFFGAVFEKRNFSVKLWPSTGYFNFTLTNNNVNWMATGLSSVLILFCTLIFDL